MSLETTHNTIIHPNEYTILVVDDNPQNLKVIDVYLREYGFKTLVASKGELALKRAQHIHPDLILLDVLLPGIDGFETCRQLKANPHTQDIPVIFMTALTETTHKLQGFQVGGVDYITKPFQYEEILARITTHLRIRALTQSLQSQAAVLSKRATQLEASNRVAQQMNAILNPDELLTTVVNLIRDKFAYYFVSVWLANDQKDRIVLQTSSGTEEMSPFAPGFALGIQTPRSLVVTVCQTGQSCLVDDIQSDTRFLLLAELPKTRTELGIPLKLGEDVIGVLDIHHDQVAAFDREDITVLETLANQISVALRNARLYRQLELMHKRSEEMSVTDPLTGMRNRRYLSRFIQDDVSKVHRDLHSRQRLVSPAALQSNIGFLLLDLDHFKAVNDMYGHDAGDRVLQQVRDILQKCCRQSDILIRWGGEEFLVEGRYLEPDATPFIAERIKKSIHDYAFDIGNGQTLHLTCSIGFACYPFVPSHPEAVNWEQVISIADRCLYIAKMSGRNAWVGMETTGTTVPENLFQRIQQDMEALVTAGELHLLSSLSDEDVGPSSD